MLQAIDFITTVEYLIAFLRVETTISLSLLWTIVSPQLLEPFSLQIAILQYCNLHSVNILLPALSGGGIYNEGVCSVYIHTRALAWGVNIDLQYGGPECCKLITSLDARVKGIHPRSKVETFLARTNWRVSEAFEQVKISQRQKGRRSAGKQMHEHKYRTSIQIHDFK